MPNTDTSPNRLIHEPSPYLQQHAHNPVDWYPWGDEAFEKARAEGKPIFLSIGYSTCHWCHVMERESFENPETAALMNELYVNIKVDREERPDVDAVYMAACQVLSGQGGWPLSAWLTPELKPYYVGTYFPPAPMHGRPSFSDALQQLRTAWDNEKERVDQSADNILNAVRNGLTVTDRGIRPEQGTDGKISEGSSVIGTAADLCFERLSGSYDEENGGFGTQPKFPRPAVLDFLLAYDPGDRSSRALTMVANTLRKISSSGTYDQLGGGFCRYSVDAQWKVPHFEKMLYDQGQLLSTLAASYLRTGDDMLAKTIRQTIEYLNQDLRHNDGAYFSAEDADSEGVEGKFYAWSLDELTSVIDDDVTLSLFTERYGITPGGNFEHGTNVLHISATPEQLAERHDLDIADVGTRLRRAEQALFEARKKRVRPHRDEKILTGWNGLVISGLAEAGMALNEQSYIRNAAEAAEFVTSNITKEGRLQRRWKDGDINIDAFLDDYAFLIQGLLDLYEATFDDRWLQKADALTREAITTFEDREGGGFYQSAASDDGVLIRTKGEHDGAEPSGNSVMALNLLRLGRLFDDTEYIDKADRTIRLFLNRVADYPDVMPLMLKAALLMERPPVQVVIVGSAGDTEEFESLAARARQRFADGVSIAGLPNGDGGDWLRKRMPLISEMKAGDKRAVAYICRNNTCEAPVTELPDSI